MTSRIIIKYNKDIKKYYKKSKKDHKRCKNIVSDIRDLKVNSEESDTSGNTTFLLRAFALDRLEGFSRRLIRRYIQPAKSDDTDLRSLSCLNVRNAQRYAQYNSKIWGITNEKIKETNTSYKK